MFRSFSIGALALIAAVSCTPASAAPTASNITFSQQYDASSSGTIGVVTYDLSTPEGPTTVALLISRASQPGVSIPADAVHGDVGPGLTTGSAYQILWRGLRSQFPNLSASDFQISVVAYDGALVPVQITPSVAPQSVAQTPDQSFTITFSDPVVGFDGSDLIVTGATTTTLVQASPQQYILGVQGIGGNITVTLPEFSARAISDYEGVSSATASLFYQDRKTISLPNSVTMDLVRIPAGTFVAGANTTDPLRLADESPTTVTLTQDWYMGVTEVTQAQWLAVMGSWPGTAPSSPSFGGAGAGASYPAYNIQWSDAKAFVSALNDHLTSTGQNVQVRLPSEAEWERSAKAGGSGQFSFGDVDVDLFQANCQGASLADDAMWYCANQAGNPVGTKPVGQKQPNAYGLYDIYGNVYEWCEDWYADYPTTGTMVDPTGPTTGSYRVIRGGCWYGNVGYCRSSHRNSVVPNRANDALGFRIAANP